MKTQSHALSLCLLLMFPGAARAAEAEPADPLAENLFPPELILHHQAEIGLSDEQREAIVSSVQQAQDRFAEMHRRMKQEVNALAALLKTTRIDLSEALAQFDRLQARERDIKRAHLELIIGIKNQLSGEQQARLQAFKKQMAAGRTAVIRQKLERVQAGVEDWQSAGRDPSPIAEIMQKFDSLMKEGKHSEAEAALDRALKALDSGDPEKDTEGRPGEKRSYLRAPARIPAATNDLAPASVRLEIESLFPPQHPWRGIAWRTCLLGAFQEARQQNKPVLLWVLGGEPTAGRC